jgi:SSS family transporter
VVLLPSYFKGEIYTAYQVLEKRFGGATQKAASVLFLVTRNLSSGLRLLLAAKVLELITNWGMPASIIVIGTSTIVYTYLGGIKAVVWTDVIQFVIYLVGAGVAMAILGDNVSGGWTAILQRADAAGKLRVFDFGLDLTQPYTFWAGVIGGLVLDTGTHGTDQMMVQRYLSARSERQAAGALVASGFVILVQFAVFLVIGLGLYALFQDAPPPVTLEPDKRFAYFIIHYLPHGVLGLVVAAVFSVTMSTLSGSLSASASSTVNDLYRPLVPLADEAHLLRLSKTLTAVWGVVQMAIAFGAIGLKDNVVNNALAVASFITGILLGLFLLGILTKRVGQNAALVGLLAGVATVSYAKFGTPLAWPWYALVGSATVVAVGLLVSLAAPRAKPEAWLSEL